MQNYPFFRFALKYTHPNNAFWGPRISYIQSFYIITEGKGQLRLEDKSINLFPGVHIFLPAGKVHTWVTGDNNPVTFLCVFFEWSYMQRPGVVYRNDYLPDISSKKIQSQYIEAPVPLNITEYSILEDNTEWLRLFQKLPLNIDVNEDFLIPDSLSIHANFFNLLSYVMNHFTGNYKYLDPWIEQFTNYVSNANAEFSNETIIQWTKKAGLSRSYFYYLFKQHKGTTPKQYWNTSQVNKTLKDLVNTDQSITKISDKFGFNSIHSYSKLFHKITGITPTEYRKRNRIY